MVEQARSNALDILYLGAGGTGWGPIDELATLAARLLGGRLLTVRDRGEVSSVRKAASLLPRVRGRGRTLLVIAANPAMLAYAARREHWLPGYERTAAWVIDSFWTDRISRFATVGRHFDDLLITDRDLVDEWRDRTGTPTHWLPWGTDTLALDAVSPARPVDLQRLGRQPDAWEDDVALVREAAALGLVAAGRPPMGASGAENQRIVREALSHAKFVLAFSNLVSPAPYTHPTRDYLTGRWLDALAAGATVVGVVPANAPDLLWPGATFEIDHADRTAGLRAVADAAAGWTPDIARRHRSLAQRRLDWRHRLAEAARLLELPQSPALVDELASISVDDRGVHTSSDEQEG